MSSLPPHLQLLLKKLKYLAMTEKGKKPNLFDFSFSDPFSIFHPYTWLGAYKRNANSESKKHLETYINTLVDQTFRAIEDPRNKEYAPMLIKALTEAKVGIGNTEETYKNFPEYVSGIRVTIDNIDHQLKKYEPVGIEEEN